MIRCSGRVAIAALMIVVLALTGCDSAKERVAKHQSQGMALLEQGQPQKAALEFRNALQIDDSFVPARFELAKILLAEGNYQGAVANFQKVVEIDPAHVEARLQLANIMLLAGQFDEALTQADAAYKAAPDNADVLIARATAHYRLKHTDQAIADANRALELRPKDPKAELLLVSERLDTGDSDAALKLADKFLADNPKDLPLNVMKVKILAARKDGAALGAHLEHIVGVFPDNANLRQLLASWYYRNGRMDDVEHELRAIRDLKPDDIETVQNLVRFLVQTRGQDAARTEIVNEISDARERKAPLFPLQSLLAEFDYQLGDKNDATALLERVTESAPDVGTANKARLQLARIRLSEKNLDAVGKLVDTVLAADSKNAEALGMRAAILAEQGKTDAAVIDLRAALNEDPDNVRLLRLAANIYQRNGNPDLAGESLANAVRASNAEPDTVLAYIAFLKASGQEAAIRSVLENAVQRRPDSPQLLTALGAVQVENKNWTAAKQVSEQLRKHDAKAADRLDAAILAGQGQTEEAVALLKRAGETFGTNSVAGTIVQVYVQNGQRAEAQKFVDSILANDPKNADALRLRGALLQLDGKVDKAIGAFEDAIAADPKDATAYVALASLQRAAGHSDAAETTIADGLAAIPDNALLMLNRADQSQTKGDYSAALDDYETLYEQHPDSVIAINNLASTLSEHFADDPEKLARAADLARRLAGVQNPQIQDTYGWILYLQKKPDEALRSLIPAAEGLPKNAWVRYHVGMAYAALDRPEEARKHLTAALDLSKGETFPPAKEIHAELERLGTIQ